MKYIVYLTTNLKSKINGINRIYVGVHQTKDPEIFDGYIGCGVYVNQPSTYMYPKTPFQYAVKKYGTDNFKREILYIFDSESEAYRKEAEIVDINFIKQPHVYNVSLGGKESWYLGRSIYQFDLNGKLLKKWNYAVELYDFTGIPRERFNYAIFNKHPLLNCLWSITNKIDITEYVTNTKGNPIITYLYSKSGKLIKEFYSRKECAEYIGIEEKNIVIAIKRQSLINKQYYVSNTLVDEFIPKARKQYQNTIFYVYKDYKYIGKYIGKEIMPIINEHSWTIIRDRLRRQNGWYKDFYISEKKIEESEIPSKKIGNGIAIDIYTKYGDFIETLYSINEVKEKYKVPSAKIKNIQLGDRYFGDYIFKYHSY